MIKNLTHTILLVEDQILIALNSKNELESYGYRVHTATSGNKAIQTFKKNKEIDLILMDIDLGPGIDGTETAKQILTERQVPILFLSSHTEKEIVEKTEDITSYGYVVKNSGIIVLDASIKMAYKLFTERMQAKSIKNELDEKKYFISKTEAAANIGSWNIDLITGKIKWSDEMYSIYGIKKNYDLSAENRFNLIHPDDRLRVNKSFNDAKRTGKNYTLQYRIITPDLIEKFIQTQTYTIKNKQGIPVSILGINQDITKKYNIEKTLKESQEIFQTSFQNNLIGMCILDISGNFIYINKTTSKAIGYTLKEIQKKNFLEITHPDDRDRNIQKFKKCLKDKKPFQIEKRCIKKDGNIIWVQTSFSPVLDNNKTITSFTAQLLDISADKKNTLKIKKSEANFQQLYESITDSVYIINNDLRYIILNKNSKNLTGKPREKLIGKKITDIYPGIEKTSFFKTYKKALKTRQNQIITDTFSVDGKTKKWYEVRVYPCPEGILCIAKDVTKTKNIENKLIKISEKNQILLKELQHRAKNSFMMIDSLLKLTMKSNNDGNVKSALKSLLNKTSAISDMYDLLYSEDSVTELSIDKYINRIIQSISAANPVITIKQSIDIFKVPVKKAIPCGIIIAELITNSLKHAFPKPKKGLINIKISTQKSTFTINYSDNGIGLPSASKKQNNGHLGLHLINSLAEQINATITSRKIKGANYIIKIPKT